MAIHELKPDVKVRDVMSSPVVTVKETESLVAAAQLMDKHEVGGIIIVDKKGRPVGLITERDIVKRVAAKDLLPSKVRASDIMSRPLVTVESGTDITDAARKMRQLGIRRLIVVDKGNLVGVVTSKDIVDVTPALIDVIAEKSRIATNVGRPREGSLAGYCDKCSIWSDNLREQEGTFLCEDCVTDLREEKTIH